MRVCRCGYLVCAAVVFTADADLGEAGPFHPQTVDDAAIVQANPGGFAGRRNRRPHRGFRRRQQRALTRQGRGTGQDAPDGTVMDSAAAADGAGRGAGSMLGEDSRDDFRVF